MCQVAAALRSVQERIERAAARSGRDATQITLVAVSKGVSVERIREGYAAGLREFGENYVQEALSKREQLPGDVRWHFIGHLQTNKARQVVGRFSLVQGVDSLRLAEELGRRALSEGIRQDVLLEVLLDESGSKFGVPYDRALGVAEDVAQVPGIAFRGLMGMAPFAEDPEAARPHFRRLRRLFDRLPAEHRHILSLGMTGDFEVAIEEGSTMIRLGTALFGRRGG